MEYVRSLSVRDTLSILSVIEAENEVARINREQAKQQRASRKPRRR